MSLLLLFESTIPIDSGAAAPVQKKQVVTASGTVYTPPEVIMLTLPIQTTIKLTLPIGLVPPSIVPPWSLV